MLYLAQSTPGIENTVEKHLGLKIPTYCGGGLQVEIVKPITDGFHAEFGLPVLKAERDQGV